MFVIKIFTNDRFSQPLGLYSVSTKENRVGGIFMIVIIKQNVILLAKVCNFAQKCYYTLQQQCRVIQVFCLGNTWPWREAMVWLYSKYPCVEMIRVFCSIIKTGEKNSTSYFLHFSMWIWSAILASTQCTCPFG